MKTQNAVEYAYNAGREFADMYQKETHVVVVWGQSDLMPECDYHDMAQEFGAVTDEMERAYCDGFNSI